MFILSRQIKNGEDLFQNVNLWSLLNFSLVSKFISVCAEIVHDYNRSLVKNSLNC